MTQGIGGGEVRRGYARLTDEESLGRQVAALESAGCEELMIEREAGAAAWRRLESHFEVLRPGDELVALGLHIFGRPTGDLLRMLADLADRGVTVRALEPAPLAIGPDSPPSERRFLDVLVRLEAIRPEVEPQLPTNGRGSHVDGGASGARRSSAALDVAAAIKLFASLSQPARLAAFLHILDSGAAGLRADALAEALHITGSALTFHLRALQEAGLVRAHAQRSPKRESGVVVVADLDRLAGLIRLLMGACGPEERRVLAAALNDETALSLPP